MFTHTHINNPPHLKNKQNKKTTFGMKLRKGYHIQRSCPTPYTTREEAMGKSDPTHPFTQSQFMAV